VNEDLLAAASRALDRIDPAVGAFITLDGSVRRQAREAPSGRLHGLIGAVKDLIDTAGVRTTRGSALFVDRIPTRSASIVERLQSEGMIWIGKTNLHEFAYGVSGYNPHFGAVRNPRDLDRTAGGSSGGSAAAVALGACDVALGTDTSGSVRIPAACCGVYGFKAAHGAYPTDGVFPLAESLDSLGFLTADIATLARVLDLSPAPADAPIRVARLGEQVELPELPVEHWTTFRAEANALHRPMLAARPALYGIDLQRRLAQEVGDLEAARSVMAGWRDSVAAALEDVDVLEGPVFDGEAPTIDAALADYRDDAQHVRGRLLSYTPVANALGWPAIAVPTADGPRHLLGRPDAVPQLLAAAERIGLPREEVLAGGDARVRRVRGPARDA
jgi:Asp-tRNA(Asn)/Glu-tRNA(Gln) amidotransferase A subunit family amidase